MDINELREEILDDVRHGRKDLPGLPDIAVRVQRVVSNENCTVAELAKIIQSDLPLAGRIVQIANSPLYRGLIPVENSHAAISRLGLNVTRNLVTSFALRRVFLTKNSLAITVIEDLWKHSVKVAAVAFTLARISPTLNPDQAMLAGLLHDIGLLSLLSFADEKPYLIADQTFYDSVARALCIELGCTVLRQWRFDPIFEEVVKNAENWDRPVAEGDENPDYADVIIVAHWHAAFGDNRANDLPKLEALPVIKKFPVFSLGPAASIELLKEAQEEIHELQALLNQ